MASLADPRNTVTVGPQLYGSEQPLDQDGYAVEGCLVGTDDGYATDISQADGYCLGIAVLSVSNTASGNAAGDLSCVCLTGQFMLDGSGVTQADVGKTAFAQDNHTVGTSQSGSIPAVGTIVGLDAASGQVIVDVKLG